MRISKRNLKLLVENLLTEGMTYSEVEKGAVKKILKLYRSFIWKCFHEPLRAPDSLDDFLPAPIDSLRRFLIGKHALDIGKDMKAEYTNLTVKEALQNLELLFISKIPDIVSETRLTPVDLIGRGEDERIRDVNRGKVLSWALKTAKQDMANNDALSLYDDFADMPIGDWSQLSVITSPITWRIFVVLDQINDAILSASRYKRSLPKRISYPRMLRRMGNWTNDVELFFQYRHLLPDDRQEITDYRGHLEISQAISEIRDAIDREKEGDASEMSLTLRQSESKEAKAGLSFYRGGLYKDNSTSAAYLKTRNHNTGYYTDPDGEGIVVAKVLNKEGAKLVGSNRPAPKREGENWPSKEPCDWCTAANTEHDYYGQYAKMGDIFYVEIGGKRYQIHFATGQYMDVTDNEIHGEEFDKVFTVLFDELAKEFGGFNEMDSTGAYPAALKIRDKYRGSAAALDAVGLLGAPQY